MQIVNEMIRYTPISQPFKSQSSLYLLTDIMKELFEEDELLENAGNHEHIVWKYMSLEHALKMVSKNQLFLANPTCWKDPYESYFVKATYEGEPFAKLFGTPKQLFCTCFTDAWQSDAQWNMYNDGDLAVMVGFDARKLLDALSQCHNTLYLGRVNYISGGWAKCRELSATIKQSLKDKDLATILGLMLRKRINFSYEHEIRLMLTRNCGDNSNVMQKKGINLHVPNLADSIVRIRVSPKVGKFTLKMLKAHFDAMFTLVPRPSVSRSRLFANVAAGKDIDLSENNQMDFNN